MLTEELQWLSRSVPPSSSASSSSPPCPRWQCLLAGHLRLCQALFTCSGINKQDYGKSTLPSPVLRLLTILEIPLFMSGGQKLHLSCQGVKSCIFHVRGSKAINIYVVGSVPGNEATLFPSLHSPSMEAHINNNTYIYTYVYHILNLCPKLTFFFRS